MSVPIRGKVARILNSREIAINVGSTSGVVVGMHFDVVYPKGDIRDPDTNEILGSLNLSKVSVRITKVQERLSLATTQKKRVNVGGHGGPLGDFSRWLMPPKWITKYESLKAEEKPWEEISEEESYVKVGDPVIQLMEEAAVK